MALLALITFANVLVRYFTNSSFAWTEEISVFLMIVLALVAGSAAVARDLHIRIEYFAEGAPRRAGGASPVSGPSRSPSCSRSSPCSAPG